MAGPKRPIPPSAIDGYRRLERTRRVAAPQHVQASTAVVPARRRPTRSARIAGIARLATFVAVLAIIIGTSVGLASADTRGAAKRSRAAGQSKDAVANRTSTPDTAPTRLVKASAPEDSVPAAADSSGSAASPKPAAKASPEPVAVTAARPRASTHSTSELPFTGAPSLDHLLLAGSALVLLGMLVQIAGQPLPANHARARAR